MNGKDWFLKGLEYEQSNDIEDAIECFNKAVKSEDIWYVDKLNAHLHCAVCYTILNNYKKGVFEAMSAASLTLKPRADVCCTLGKLYYMMGDMKWAEMWFEMAISNITIGSEGDGVEEKHYTWAPLISLSAIAYRNGDLEKAVEYNNAVLLMDPNNETALENTDIYSKPIEEK